jgi:hypothetical protein
MGICLYESKVKSQKSKLKYEWNSPPLCKAERGFRGEFMKEQMQIGD